jgi:DNA processing protein
MYRQEDDMREASALLGLVRVDGLGAQRITKLIEFFGSAQAILLASHHELHQANIPPQLISGILQQARRDNDADYEKISLQGITILGIHDLHYPALLAQIPNPPLILFVRGNVTAFAQRSVAMVGTRKPSGYGVDITRRLAHDLACQDVTIVSGLASGIDAVAHEYALIGGGQTIAVLPSGVDLIYPERNRWLANKILASRGSALVSEFYPGTKALPPLFPARNRLISGLAQGVIVSEAGEKSGALITVKAALEQGREVMAVPGSVFSEQSAGCLELLRQGAIPVRNAHDVCESLGYAIQVPAEIDDPLLQLLQVPRHIDELCRILMRAPADMLGDLLMRELRGEVSDQGQGFYVWRRQ